MDSAHKFLHLSLTKDSSLSSPNAVAWLLGPPAPSPGIWFWSMCLAESCSTTWLRRAGWPPKRPGSSSDKLSPPSTSATVTPYGPWAPADFKAFLFLCNFQFGFSTPLRHVESKSVPPPLRVCLGLKMYMVSPYHSIFHNAHLKPYARLMLTSYLIHNLPFTLEMGDMWNAVYCNGQYYLHTWSGLMTFYVLELNMGASPCVYEVVIWHWRAGWRYPSVVYVSRCWLARTQIWESKRSYGPKEMCCCGCIWKIT